VGDRLASTQQKWTSAAETFDIESRRKILVYEKGLRNIQNLAVRQRDSFLQRKMLMRPNSCQDEKRPDTGDSKGSFSRFMPVTPVPAAPVSGRPSVNVTRLNSAVSEEKPRRYYQYGFPRHALVPSQFYKEQFGKLSKTPEMEFPSWMYPELASKLGDFYEKYPAPKSELVKKGPTKSWGLMFAEQKDKEEDENEEDKIECIIEATGGAGGGGGCGGGAGSGGPQNTNPATKRGGKMDKLLSVHFA